MASFLTEKTFYLLCGPLAGAAVGASTMAVMHQGSHPSAMEAEIACQEWKGEATMGTRLCFKEADTNQFSKRVPTPISCVTWKNLSKSEEIHERMCFMLA